MADATLRGRFVWHELMTTDTKSAGGFFSSVVNWKPQTWEQNPSYTMLVSGGRPMAGLMALPPDARAAGAPPSWLTYIGTPDVDATAREAVSLGGKILKPATAIPTVGRFALVQDPQGAVFAAFTPTQAPPPGDAVPAVGDFSWHELVTTDWRAALSFYQRLFGWEATSAMDMGPEMGTYQMYGFNKRAIGGMFNKTPQMPGPPAWLPYIKVADAKAAAATIARLGGRVVHGPAEVPGGDLTVQAFDLQGGMFALHSVKATVARKARPASKPSAARKAKRPAKRVAKRSGGRPASRSVRAVKRKGSASRGAGKRKKTAPRAGAAKRRKGSTSRGRRRR